jgi:hypothetical protein
VSAVRTHRARVAALTRHHSKDDPKVVDATRDLRAASLEQYIRQVVAEAPPLTNEQREKLAMLLHGSTPNRGAAA